MADPRALPTCRQCRKVVPWLALSVALLGCRAHESERAPPRDPSQLAMRTPERSPGDGEAGANLGTLTPVAQELAAQPEAEPTGDLRKESGPPPLIHVSDDAQRTPYPLRGGDLVLPGGLVVHRVPKGVSVQRVREATTDDEVWEVRDARDKRLALIAVRTWRRAAASDEDLLSATRATRDTPRRARWQNKPVRVVTDRFRSDTHIYTVDRLHSGTDWMWRGLELTSDR